MMDTDKDKREVLCICDRCTTPVSAESMTEVIVNGINYGVVCESCFDALVWHRRAATRTLSIAKGASLWSAN